MKKKQWMPALLLGVLLLVHSTAAAGAKQTVDLAEAAHLTAEQKLEGTVHNQVVYAQNGVIIWDQIIKEDALVYHYPRIHLKNRHRAAAAINHYFKSRASASRQAYHKANRSQETLTSQVNYILSYHGDRYLSLREYGIDYYERAAHPSSWEQGTTFDLRNGSRVTWQELMHSEGLKPYDLKRINEKLLASPYGLHHAFYSDFKGLNRLPENYYLDEKGVIHFVFQQYEIAPYAAGIIDLPMCEDKEER